MPTGTTESFKKNIEQLRAEKDIEKRRLSQRTLMALKPSKRSVKFEDETDSVKIYEDWLKQYKIKSPAFKAEENKFKLDENGNGCIDFSDPDAEEDFVRHLAASNSHGSVLDKGILIAKFENGKLIDPRTNQEFPEGEYSKLVQKLDSGLSYSEICSSEPTAPKPLSTKPY